MYSNQKMNNEMKFVVFRLGDEEFGAPIQQVYEILRMVEITRVPRAPHFIVGVINLRGKVIPVLDLRQRFAFPQDTPAEKQRIMEVEIENYVLGMIVDSVTEVVSVPVNVIEPPPPIIADIGGEYLDGIAKFHDRIIILLNFDKVLSQQETKQIDQVPIKSLTGGEPEGPSNQNQEED